MELIRRRHAGTEEPYAGGPGRCLGVNEQWAAQENENDGDDEGSRRASSRRTFAQEWGGHERSGA